MKLWTDTEKINIGGNEIDFPFTAKQALLSLLPAMCDVQGYTPVQMLLRRRIIDILDKTGDTDELNLSDEHKKFLLERMSITRFKYALENNLRLLEELEK